MLAKNLKRVMFVLTLAIAVSCSLFQYTTKITLEGGERTTFKLSGSGKLGAFIIYGPQQREGVGDRQYALWEIQPVAGYMNGKFLVELEELQYGVVPAGYQQIYPEEGKPVPLLVPNVKYEYWAQTINAPHARKYFEIKNGKAFELPDNKWML